MGAPDLNETNTATYAAFISYAREDEAVAARLQKRLEGYALPKSMRSHADGKLKPVFRDRSDLAADRSLGASIEAALSQSRALIVLCSPAAKASKWVSEEIRVFKDMHPSGPIICALLDGDPETAFPQILLSGGDEPLAADFKGPRGQERYGTHQLVAALLNVGLDTILQRDAERRRKRASIFISGALLFSAVMAGMTIFALSAQQEAEASRSDAEELVEYMLEDLRGELEPINRLGILNGLGDEVARYYAKQPLQGSETPRLIRRLEARLLMADVAIRSRDHEKAETELLAANLLAQELKRRDADNSEVIFALAQAYYWQGQLMRSRAGLGAARPAWEKYAELGHQLYQRDPENPEWIMEKAWGEQNLGAVDYSIGDPERAIARYRLALSLFEAAKARAPKRTAIDREIANTTGWLADALLVTAAYSDVRAARQAEWDILEQGRAANPRDNVLAQRALVPQRELLILDMLGLGRRMSIDQWANYTRQSRASHENDPENSRAFRSYCHATVKPYALALVADASEAIGFSTIGKICQAYLETKRNYSFNDAFIASLPAYWRSEKGWPDITDTDVKTAILETSEQQKLFVWYVHLRLLQRQGRRVEARKLARFLVDSAGGSSTTRSPQHWLSLMEAYGILGDCAKHRQAQDALLARGYAIASDETYVTQCL